MTINRLSDLPAIKRCVVIINVGTKWVTTLALLSAMRYAQMPVLVIDCESKDGSWEYFENLMTKHEFFLLSAPLRAHGHTLDWLFKNIPVEHVLLMDSDTEILNRTILNIIDDTEHYARIFGWGFVQGPQWMTKVQMGFDHEKLGLYQERMWLPFAMLDTAKIREALDAGLSFIDHIRYNDFAPSVQISKLLYSRFQRERWVRSRLKFLNPFRKTYYNSKPSYLYCDTGADIFQHLRYERGYLFAGIHADINDKYISHFHGVTRRTLHPGDTNAASVDDVLMKVYVRLRRVYGVTPPSEIE
jgi:hypothetical protein